jgi:hypothetical protein
MPSRATGLPVPPAARRPKAHDLDLMESTGYLERLKIAHQPSDPAAMFREPSKVLSAYHGLA